MSVPPASVPVPPGTVPIAAGIMTVPAVTVPIAAGAMTVPAVTVPIAAGTVPEVPEKQLDWHSSTCLHVLLARTSKYAQYFCMTSNTP